MLYRHICFLRFSNHPLLLWKMPFFPPSHGTVDIYLHGLLPYHNTTDWQTFLCFLFQPYT
jgi:hypothetical protein